MNRKRRIKITFSTINEGNYTIINLKDLAESNKQVREAMKTVVRDFEKKEAQSQQEAALLVLNA